MALLPAVTLLLPALLLAVLTLCENTLLIPPPIAIVLGAVCLYSVISLGDSIVPMGLIPERGAVARQPVAATEL